MIEIIFVIVILGILSAVAIPKLNATRDDAYISKTATAIAAGATDIAGFAVSSGQIKNDVSKMSNIIAGLISSNEAKQDDITIPKVDFKIGNIATCVTMSISSGNDANLSISFGDPLEDTLCQSLQSMFHVSDYPIPLKGDTVIH